MLIEFVEVCWNICSRGHLRALALVLREGAGEQVLHGVIIAKDDPSAIARIPRMDHHYTIASGDG
jgi:hypothetical protein